MAKTQEEINQMIEKLEASSYRLSKLSENEITEVSGGAASYVTEIKYKEGTRFAYIEPIGEVFKGFYIKFAYPSGYDIRYLVGVFYVVEGHECPGHDDTILESELDSLLTSGQVKYIQ